MTDRPTFGALWKSGEINAADLDASVKAYLAGEARVVVGGRYGVDVTAALDARPLSKRLLRDEKTPKAARATAVRNAIVRAVAEPR